MDRVRRWADLPIDILSSIANRLGLIDLLSFRGICKDFRSASSTASAEIESSRTPWLLIPDMDSSNCLIYDDKLTTYNRNIPELRNTVYLPSYQGWLLLLKQIYYNPRTRKYEGGSVFFFSPFSLEKIVLPKLPKNFCMEGHAAFSDVPTSPCCIVTIIRPMSEVLMISKGQTNWTHHPIPSNVKLPCYRIATATFDQRNETFYYMNESNNMLTFSVKDKKWNPYPMEDSLPIYNVDDPFDQMIRYNKDTIDIKDDESVRVCGLTFHKAIKSRPVVYPNEGNPLLFSKQERKAVWIQPRFFEPRPNQYW